MQLSAAGEDREEVFYGSIETETAMAEDTVGCRELIGMYASADKGVECPTGNHDTFGGTSRSRRINHIGYIRWLNSDGLEFSV